MPSAYNNVISLDPPQTGNRYVKMFRTCQKIGPSTWVRWTCASALYRDIMVRYLQTEFANRDQLEVSLEGCSRVAFMTRFKVKAPERLEQAG